MKRLLFVSFMFAVALCACQKAPELTLTGPASIDLSVDGGSGSITFTANRDWTVSSSDSWITISPSSGSASDGAVTVTVRCNANTTYEDRTATVTIRMEELSQTVTVRQPANLGIVLSTQAYDLQSGAKTIDVTVQANVDYTVDISEKWIKQTGTKALESKTLSFSIDENTTYDNREGIITLKPKQTGVAEQVISVKQAQKDALNVEKTSYDMPYGGGEIEIKVEANVAFDVTPNVDWLHYVSTKALSSSTVVIKVDENTTYSAREGKVEIAQQNGSLKHTITVKQAGRIAVTSVELNKTSVSLMEGTSETLTATVKPDNATDKTVTWDSSDPAIATVDETGKVVAIKEGSAKIIAKAGAKTAECALTIFKEVPITSIELNKTDITLNVGESETLVATIKPDNATDKTVSWVSSNSEVASIDEAGKVTALSEGATKIIATAGAMSAECTLTVISVPNGNISFADEKIKQKLVERFDSDGDGEISYKEAALVTSIEGVFGAIKTYTSFNEFQYFTGVTVVPKSMFENWNLLESIVLPQSITVIYESAFKNCGKLLSINIPESVTSIRGYAFDGCEGLHSVFITNMEGWLKINFNIGSHPFIASNSGTLYLNNQTVVDVVVPESISKINDNAFYGCQSIKSVTISGDITYLGYDCFSGCSNLAEIELPVSLTFIGSSAFSGCRSLNKITIPNGITQIGYGLFAGCSSLTEIIIPNSITSIGNSAFWGCSSLTYFSIPETVSTIEDNTFNGCSSLATIAIPESVSCIGNSAFESCSSLTSINLPESITSIGNNAFKGCSSLESVVLPSSISKIEVFTFYECSNLKSVTIPDSVSEIGSFAFKGCEKLISISIPSKVTRLEQYTFYGCSSLKNFTIPSSITFIDDNAFGYCTGLEGITVLPTTPPGMFYTALYNTNECPIYVPAESVDTYKTTGGWKTYESRIQAIVNN